MKEIRDVAYRDSAAELTTSTEEDRRKNLRLQGSAAGSTRSTEEDQGSIFICKDQQHDQSHHRQRIKESFYIVGRRKRGRPFRYQDLQNLKYHQIQVVYLLTLDRLENKSNLRL